ncbi:hypothetical protein TNCV_2377951 [Trichonephila clavipes]|nr:hypothetical protein TNCV_2377951 [Trichonephila clavipes]
MAKEKSSVLWLLSKAFEGDIPNDLLEPFYRDHENIRRLKPKIVHSLANAELYCLALVNIYADPNYHNLDHQGIVQVLMRKGVQLIESREAPLTETTLVQTAPIRMKKSSTITKHGKNVVWGPYKIGLREAVWSNRRIGMPPRSQRYGTIARCWQQWITAKAGRVITCTVAEDQTMVPGTQMIARIVQSEEWPLRHQQRR